MCDLELNDPIPDDETIAEGNSCKCNQGKEDGKERSQRVKGPVGARRNNVFLGEHLQHIGHAVKHSEEPKPEDLSAIGPDAILYERGLLPFHPRMEPCQVQSRKKDDSGQSRLYDQDFHHLAIAPAVSFAAGTSTPRVPMVS